MIRQDKTKIKSLQSLRALAFLGIFFGHAKFTVSYIPSLAVSVFFVMSGFLMMHRYHKEEYSASFLNNIRFSLSKILKLYPLHIITMFCALVLCLGIVLYMMVVHNESGYASFIWLGGYVILHLFLIQSWVPNHVVNVSLNGVAWYLSVTAFLYFMFQWFKKIVERFEKTVLCVICGLILVIEIVVCIPFIKLFGSLSPIYIWFMYCFPVFRMGDFFCGCTLEKLLFDRNESVKPHAVGGGKCGLFSETLQLNRGMISAAAGC